MRAFSKAVSTSLLGIGLLPAVTVRDHRDPSRGGGAYRLDGSVVFEMTLDFTAGQTRTCETRNLSPRADPVLHLIAPKTGSGAVNEVARDDDSAGALNARFTFRAPTAGKYRLIMRANWSSGQGTADLYCDGRVVWLKLPVGGAFKRLETLRAGETLTTVPLPNGPRSHLLYTLDENGKMLERYESGPNESAGRPLPNSSVQIVMLGGVFPDQTRPVRLVRNDRALSGHDPDGDGLGTELEKQIGTCSSTHEVVGNWDCSRSVDARDTDGDGLQDGVELLGSVQGAPYQLLPRWGANPLHKDIFIEVDSMLKTRNEAPTIMMPAVALAMARIYADIETDPLFRLAHAQTLNNPDLQPGVSLHFDTGQNPPANAAESEFATYGDWGGHSVVAAICNGGDCHGADAGDVWQQNIQHNRAGLFHYVLGYPGDGGQAPLHTVAVNLPLSNANTAAHEFGHSLGLDHKGPDHPGADANCKPNFPSLMSYAYLNQATAQTFSDGYGRAALNNVSLNEKTAVSAPASGPGKKYLTDLRDVFAFNVDMNAGSVDWNRDGVFSDGVTKAYANDNRSGCEFTRANSMKTGGLTDGVPALSRLGNMTMIFYSDERDRRLWLDYTTDDLSCPSPTEGRCGPPLKRKEVNETWNRGILSIAAHRIAVGTEKRTLIVYRTAAGLFETTMTADFKWSAPVAIPVTSPAVDEFSLTGNESHAILGFKNAQGNVMMKVRGAAPGSWGGDELVRDAAGNAIPIAGFLSCPALLEVTASGGTKMLLGLFPAGPQGLLRLYSQDPSNGRWIPSLWQLSDEPTIGRPAMSWEPVGPGSPLPGRLRIVYLHRGGDGLRIVRQRTLQAIGLGAGAQLKLVDEDHDNVWYYGNGVDALFEPEFDSNTRVAVATALIVKNVPQPHVLELRPKADGVLDFSQRNWNDWQGIDADICRTLKSGGAQVNCKAWPF
jgi:hypothetical protein